MQLKFAYDPPSYSGETGLVQEWEPGFVISVNTDEEGIVLKANRAGLVTLAKHLLTLAQLNVPTGAHFHYDAGVSLEDDSLNLVVTTLGE